MTERQKETQFDFSKESKLNNKKIDWFKILHVSSDFAKKHKEWFALGVGAFLFIQGVTYVFSDSPEEIKSKTIAMQTAYDAIPSMIQDIENSKGSYDEIVNYLSQREFDIKTNAMQTRELHVSTLENQNAAFKKWVNQNQETLKIIDKKIKETKSFSSLTSDEKKYLLQEYTRFKANDKYYSNELNKSINTYTTIDADDKPTTDNEVKELQKLRADIRENIAEIKKNKYKK